MRHTRSYSQPAPAPKMPVGLVELMEGLSRGVLRENPTDLYKFCADHMKKLIDLRDPEELKNQPITIHEKILKAQEIIKQRAEERCLKFDQEMQSNLSLNSKENELILVSENEGNEKRSDEILEDNVEFHEVVEQQSSEQVQKSKNDDLLSLNKLTIVNQKERFHQDSFSEKNNFEIEEHKEKPAETENKIKTNEADASQSELSHQHKFSEENNLEIDNTLPVEGHIEEPAENENTTHTNETQLAETIEIPEIEKKTEDEKFNDTLEIIVDTDHTKDSTSTLEDATLETLSAEEKDKPVSIASEEKKDFSEIDVANVLGVGTDISGGVLESNVNTGENKQINDEYKDKSEVVAKLEPLNNQFALNQLDEIKTTGTDKSETQEVIISSGDKPSDNSNVILEEHNDEQIDLDISENKTEDANSSPNIKPVNSSNEQDYKKLEISEISQVHVGDSMQVEEMPNNDEIIVSQTPTHINYTNGEKDKEIVLSNKNSSRDDKTNLKDINIDNDDGAESIGNETPTAIEDVMSVEIGGGDIEIKLKVNGTNEGINDDNFDGNMQIPESTDIQDSNALSNLMDLETAAVTIQKVFRSFLFRRSTLDDVGNEGSMDADTLEDHSPENAPATQKEDIDYQPMIVNKDRRPLGLTRMDTVLQTVNEEKSLSLSDDSSTMSSAATTIQAHVRGFLVRNRMLSNKTVSTNSFANSDGQSTSLEAEIEPRNKTILNIHIVPEGGHFTGISRDESMAVSVDLPYDVSPPSSANLHPLGYNKNEPRKQLKREDAIQSISPPSTNSGKLSEDVDSVKDASLGENDSVMKQYSVENSLVSTTAVDDNKSEDKDDSFEITDAETVNEVLNEAHDTSEAQDTTSESSFDTKRTLTKMSSDETDVVTAISPVALKKLSTANSFDNKPGLLHSGEFHDIPIPTKVSRSDPSVVRGE